MLVAGAAAVDGPTDLNVAGVLALGVDGDELQPVRGIATIARVTHTQIKAITDFLLFIVRPPYILNPHSSLTFAITSAYGFSWVSK
jgi:hypothetical protein